jgi:hypothetical protein
MERLRTFNAIHIDEDCSNLTGYHDNELFFNCTFDKVNRTTLRNCVLNESRFLTERIQDILGFTLTLDCFSFDGVEWSELTFDLLLCLMIMSTGNDAKREKLKDVLGKTRHEALMRVLRRIE